MAEQYKVGDRVIIIKSAFEGYEDDDEPPYYLAGDYGVIVEVDTEDDDLPYLIRFKRVNNHRGCMRDSDPDAYRKNHWWVDNSVTHTELFKVTKGTTWAEVKVLADIVKERE